jgi:hypothetical protein
VDALISRGRGVALRLALAWFTFATAAHAQVASEAVVKAAFLYKFAGYIEWPAGAFAAPDAPLVIAIDGADEVFAELERLAPGRKVNGRPVDVRRLREGEAMEGVHVAFVGRAERNPRAVIGAALRAGALAVTEVPGGLEMGAAINFVPVDNRIGFEVSLDSAEKSGVRISARILPIARRVVGRP